MIRRYHGDFMRIHIPIDEVKAFKKAWPCSGLPDKSVYFEFSLLRESYGNLTDIFPGNLSGEGASVLCEDAKTYGFNNILPEWLPAPEKSP